MLKRAWKPVVGLTGLGSVYLYATKSASRQTFELSLPIRGPDGKREMTTKAFSLLTIGEVDERIRQNATVHYDQRPDGAIWNHTTAFLASNNPIEDANAHQIIQRDPSDPASPGDYLFFAVMDGHAGTDTSQLLSRTLIRATALELAALSSAVKDGKFAKPNGLFPQISSLFASNTREAPVDPFHPDIVSSVVRQAFVSFDSEILKAPLRVLVENWDAETRKKNIIPDLSKHPAGMATMLPNLSGSCALMAIFDTAHRDLYIACTGDSRAVAGVWEPTTDGKGIWKVDVLSEDQTGRNPKELARIRSEHPKAEEEDVVHRGRILGGLEPSRAFGDSRYKWPAELQYTLYEAFMAGSNTPGRKPPPLLKTPPYVTAEPVVTHRKFDFGSSDKGLRFVVLATDGLWDALSSEDVVSLVGAHLSGLRGDISKSKLHELVPITIGTSTVEGKDHKREDISGSWAFRDDNLSAHLIRNALGGATDSAVRQLVSIPAPYSRRFRDDITVTVIWWEEGQEGNARVSTSSPDFKAKL